MNDKYCVVVYPHDIKFINESGTISYYVDRKVSDYVKELQDKLSKIEDENRKKDINNLQLQSNWNSLREWLEEEKTRLARECSHIYEDSLGKTKLVSEDIFNELDEVLYKMNELEGKNEK